MTLTTTLTTKTDAPVIAIDTIARRKGSTLDRFIRIARDQEWLLEAYAGVLRGHTIERRPSHDSDSVVVLARRTDLSAILDTDQITTGYPHRVAIQATLPGGSYTTGLKWHWTSAFAQDANGDTVEQARPLDQANLAIAHLVQGPRAKREAAEKAEASALAEARRHGDARIALALAATTEEVERWKTQVAHDLRDIDRRIKAAVQSVEAKATETLQAIADGTSATGTFGGGPFSGNHSVSEANTLAGRREELRRTAEHLEFLFGPLPKVTW